MLDGPSDRPLGEFLVVGHLRRGAVGGVAGHGHAPRTQVEPAGGLRAVADAQVVAGVGRDEHHLVHTQGVAHRPGADHRKGGNHCHRTPPHGGGPTPAAGRAIFPGGRSTASKPDHHQHPNRRKRNGSNQRRHAEQHSETAGAQPRLSAGPRLERHGQQHVQRGQNQEDVERLGQDPRGVHDQVWVQRKAQRGNQARLGRPQASAKATEEIHRTGTKKRLDHRNGVGQPILKRPERAHYEGDRPDEDRVSRRVVGGRLRRGEIDVALAQSNISGRRQVTRHVGEALGLSRGEHHPDQADDQSKGHHHPQPPLKRAPRSDVGVGVDGGVVEGLDRRGV